MHGTMSTITVPIPDSGPSMEPAKRAGSSDVGLDLAQRPVGHKLSLNGSEWPVSEAAPNRSLGIAAHHSARASG